MTGTVVPQLLSARRAAGLTRTPWPELRGQLEAASYRIVKIAGRELVAETDLAAFVAGAQQPTLAESVDRVQLAMDMACEEMGVRKRARRRTGGAR